jgi:hypothetical protein
MATVKKIAQRALRLLSITESGEVPSHEEMSDAVDSLNAMLHEWELNSIPLNHVDAGVDDTLPYPENHTNPIIYNLAIQLAPEYGASTPAEVVAMADNGYSMLQNYYFDPPDAETDPALHPYYNPNRFFY